MPINEDASFLDTMPANVAAQFLDRVERSGPSEAFRAPEGEGWKSYTWEQTGQSVIELAAGLMALGVKPEERVAIASSTRYEWVLADLAIMCAGAATTTVYPSTNAEDTRYIVGDSGSVVLFAEDVAQIDKIVEHRAELPHVHRVVCFGKVSADHDGWVTDLAELQAMGREFLKDNPDAVRDQVAAIPPDQLATLIYTSGTTGRPKGVRLRHRAWVYEGEVIKAQGILDESDLQFLWLPMSHSFGKVLLSAQMACGFATAVDGRVERIIDNLAVVKPTFMGAAPRIFEKAHSRIVTMQAAAGGAKERLFKQAFALGLEVDARKRAGQPIPAKMKLQHALFDRLVFSKVRKRFGGRVRFFISGSAALNREVAQWFHAAGIVILEGYGMTENAAGAAVNHPDHYKFGSVGLPMVGSEIKIAEDGEVLIRGPHVMEGYHNLPEATAEALTEDGWLHTGDIGELDEDGFLKITDRKKDLFKTSGGKYIAPSAIESQFKAICPYVSQFLVIGNERNFCSALVTLDPDQMTTWAEMNDMAASSYEEVVGSSAVADMVAGYVEELNERLNRWETIKKHVILPRDLTIEDGELTPSMKVKRKIVEERYADNIEGLYS